MDHIRKRNIFFLFIFFIVISFYATAVSAGTVTLAWDAPTTNEDGSPLTDLAGYRVYYGTSSHLYYQNFGEGVNIGNVTTYTVSNLTEGTTYYFATTAYNTSGHESDYSSEVSTTIPSTEYTLTVNKAGTGSGSVTSSPAGINCGSDCTETYSVGTVVTLTAAPASDSTFTGWSGSGCSGTGTCSITINTNTTVTANFTIANRSITVTSPNGGETWLVGDANTITWSSSNAGSNVKIDLSRDAGSTWSPLTASTANDGSYQWTVTSPISSTCRIKITSISYPSVSGMSNSNFTIANRSITVTSPNGGEVIPSGSVYSIQWVSPADAVKFDLMYSLDNGITWVPIPNASNVITGTSCNWTVPKPWGNRKNKCLIKVIGYDTKGVKIGADKSNVPFTIEVVKVTSPNGGETLTSGSTHVITWTTNVTKKEVAKVKLHYTKNGGVTWEEPPITAIKGSNPGSFAWTVPPVGKTKENCKIVVELKDADGNVLAQDKSDSYFTIQP